MIARQRLARITLVCLVTSFAALSCQNEPTVPTTIEENPTPETPELDRLQIGFNEPTSDGSVLEMLAEHSMNLHAVYLVSPGYHSTYRTRRSMTAGELLRDARRRLRSMASKNLKVLPIRVARFLEENSVDRIRQHEYLRNRGNSYLDLQHHLRATRDAAVHNLPVVVGIEVSGSESAIEELRAEMHPHSEVALVMLGSEGRPITTLYRADEQPEWLRTPGPARVSNISDADRLRATLYEVFSVTNEE